MDKNVATEKRPSFNFVIISLLMLFSASWLVSHPFRKAEASAPMEAPLPVSSIIKEDASKAAQQNPKQALKQGLQIQQTPEGNLSKEAFDKKGRRVSKIISTPNGALINRWDFEPISGNIIRYQVNEYDGTRLVQRRVARWQYPGDGGFIKTNQIYDAKAKQKNSFVEFVNAKKIKFKEEWFDENKRQVAEKLWDPETGKFLSYIMTEHGIGGFSNRTYLNEKGKAIRDVHLTPSGKLLNASLFQKKK